MVIFRTKIKERRGFTLIELLVVIAIISLLATVVLSSVKSSRQKADFAMIKIMIGQYVNAINMYHSDHGLFPPTGASDTSSFCLASPPCSVEDPHAGDSPTLRSALSLYMKSTPPVSTVPIDFFYEEEGFMVQIEGSYYNCFTSLPGDPLCTEASATFLVPWTPPANIDDDWESKKKACSLREAPASTYPVSCSSTTSVCMCKVVFCPDNSHMITYNGNCSNKYTQD